MNCKIRDMAIVIRVPKQPSREVQDLVNGAIGATVRCVSDVHFDGKPGWIFEHGIAVENEWYIAKIRGMPDYCLQPIRGVPLTEEITDEVAA